MKKYFFERILFSFFLLSWCTAVGQTLSGIAIDEISGKPVQGVLVRILETSHEEITDAQGMFSFSDVNIQGEYILTFSKNTFLQMRFPVRIFSDHINLGEIVLRPNLPEMQQQVEVVFLEDHELDEEAGGGQNISGLLQASRDVFLNAAAFDFSPAFFRPRGYDSEYSKVLINGVEMNKFYNGRPLWSNWGGLNDVQRNVEFAMGTTPSEVSFGGPAGSTNFILRASQYPSGGKFSYAVANRSYSGRAMGSYHSGLLPSNWAYSLSISKRFARESYIDGTSYDASSLFVAIEKILNDSHSLSFTGIYSPSERGKSSPNSQEVFELKGADYNSYWGWHDGKVKNSRIRRVEEPIIMLNHQWGINKDLEISNHVAFQTGQIGNSRIDYGGTRAYHTGNESIFIGGGSNPDPAYYQKLPSYFLRFENNPDYRSAYLAEQDFRTNGQINWSEMIVANQTAAASGGNAIYALYEDRVDDIQLSVGSGFRYRLGTEWTFSGSVSYRQLLSENFASVIDLFGAPYFLDVDSFSEGIAAHNNLQQPEKLVGENDIFKYHYELSATSGEGFLQAQVSRNKIEAYFAATGSGTNYHRTGRFQNGNFPDNSLGTGKLLNFGNYGLKNGITYKINGRHYLSTNLGFLTKPPALRNTYSNARQNHDIVLGLKNEKIFTADAGYNIRAPFITGRITAFYGEFQDATEVSFYYADGLSGTGREVTNAFVQEILTGVGKKHRGVEFGVEVPLNSTLKLRSTGSIGNYLYNSDPKVYLTSDDFTGIKRMGSSLLKGYRLPGGPQQALQAGLEYRDPSYWWISGSTNFFSKAFIDVAPLSRTSNFYLDLDGFPIVNYDEEVAENLLRQEEFGNYMLVNIVGGKSWRLKNRFVGFFGSLNNILNTTYKTGGYEQSRNVNYTLLKADMEREKPLFGSKYWFGTGTTYYAHVYYRF